MKKLRNIPLVQKVHRNKYKQRFTGECYGCFYGVYDSFEEAIKAAPNTKKIGYDYTELAKEYRQKLKSNISSYDYPVLFWLKEALAENSTVFDFGGNVGIHFYQYDKYLQYPANLKWIVCELPEIAKVGEELAKERQRTELLFVNDFHRASDTNIFIASGSIQYIESLSDSLMELAKKPKHLLISKLPLYDGERFVTLQNGGQVFYPQYVFNKKEFIEHICGIGYKLIDIWEDRLHSCNIPFQPEKSVRFYSGLYFKLAD